MQLLNFAFSTEPALGLIELYTCQQHYESCSVLDKVIAIIARKRCYCKDNRAIPAVNFDTYLILQRYRTCGFPATARISCWSLSGDSSESSVKKWNVLERTSQIKYLTQTSTSRDHSQLLQSSFHRQRNDSRLINRKRKDSCENARVLLRFVRQSRSGSPRSQLLCCLWLAGTLSGWLSDLSR